MNIHIEFLRTPGPVQEALKNDGWHLSASRTKGFTASHPQVPNETTARARFHLLGLLTSSGVRIDFYPWAN
jgi:hypothetical protein